MKVATQSTQTPFNLPLSSQPSSAKSLIDQLDKAESQSQAISLLNDVVDFYWPEISEVTIKIETLAQNPKFDKVHLANLLLAKLNFHLGNFDDSVKFALRSGDVFDIEENTQFVETILAVILDKYTSARVSGDEKVVAALENVFCRVVGRCMRDCEFKQLIGIGLDCRRLDIIEGVLKATKDAEEAASLLYYTKKVAANLKNCYEFQQHVIQFIVNLFMQLPKLDYVFICDCLISTRQPEKVAEAINHLAANESTVPEALQIAFNVQSDTTQDFLNVVIDGLKGPSEVTLQGLKNVLSGKVTSQLYMEFLCRSNKTDPLILEKTKATLNPQMSLHHQALSCANGFTQAGTTNDEFLRKNLDFLSHASNWAKFSATVSLGSIHRGQLERSRELLSAYLPKAGVSGGSVYSEGGSLMALGLIHANHGADILPYLLEQLASSQSEIVQHGACLGLGVSGMASKNDAVVEVVKGILYADNAIAGEAAGVSIGLLMLGSGDVSLCSEMKQYAHESQHEKIIRSLALGMALIQYGCQDKADWLINELEAEKDPILRYGSVWTVAMAYAGTSSNFAVNKLLHFAVSDASDDVRRAAVMSLGFVLFRNPEELPRLVELLTESYNPHVRYGSALALGIAFSGTANKRAIDLITPMCKDLTDFVRQAAYLALALILMQNNDHSASTNGGDQQAVTSFRRQLEQVISTRHEDQLAKFGAIMAQGILDAGGRNVRLALNTPSGHVSLPGITGLALFCQFWYWYPFAHFLSLSFAPTALIACTSNLKLPKLAFISNAPPSRFAYPEPTKPTVAAAPKKIVTAILSTTAKAAARAKKQGSTTPMLTSESKMSIDEEKEEPSKSAENDKAESPVVEVNFETIDNFSRVLPVQVELVQVPMDSRFQPVSFNTWRGGVIVLKDSIPSAGDFDIHEIEKKSAASPTPQSSETFKSPSVKSPRLSPEHTSPSTSAMMED